MAAAKQTLRKSNDNTSLAQSLNGVKPFTVLTVIRTHASSHAFVELVHNGCVEMNLIRIMHFSKKLKYDLCGI